MVLADGDEVFSGESGFTAACLCNARSIHSMRARRRDARTARRQTRSQREQNLRTSIWLQSHQHFNNNHYEDEPHLSTDSISDNNSRSPSPLDNNPTFDDCSTKDPNDTGDILMSGKSDDRRLFLQRRDGLINITIRTMKLMKRNQLLQQRLAQLQAETRAFVRSVMNNPENQGLRLNSASALLDKQRDSIDSKSDEEFTDVSSLCSSPMETQDELEESGESSAPEK